MYTLGILLNLCFLLVEFAVGICYSTMGLLSDAGHNLSDVGSLVISMVAFLLAQRHTAKNFTYGYRKATIHASLFNPVILLVAVGGIAVECIQKLMHPTSVAGLPIIITAGVGILVNGTTALLFMKGKETDLNVKGAYLHMLADTLVSIGVVISGIVIMFTGWTILDPIIGLAIAIVILLAGWGMLRGSLRLALDGIPLDIDFLEIQEHILTHDNVADIHHLHIWPISTTENALTAHIVLKDINGLEMTKTQLRAMLSKHGIAHSTFEIELSGTKCARDCCYIDSPNPVPDPERMSSSFQEHLRDDCRQKQYCKPRDNGFHRLCQDMFSSDSKRQSPNRTAIPTSRPTMATSLTS